MIGKSLGKYRVERLLGSGGMGEVYLATDRELRRPVALKFLAADMTADPVRRARLVREARLVAALAHPHIATIYEILENEGQLVLAMEFVDGESLSELIGRGTVPLKRILQIGQQVASALGAAHQRNIVHRDVKPGNIIVTADGDAKLLDFGLARTQLEAMGVDSDSRLATATAPLSEPGLVLGTAGYMSPEQVSGRPAGPESDIFSLGATLYEMATGTRAFKGDSPSSLLAAVLRDTPAPLRSLRPELPPELERILTRTLAKEPGERYHDARDLAADLRALRLRFESADSVSDVAMAPSPPRRRRLLAVSLIMALGVLGIIAWRLIGPLRGPQASPTRGRLTLLLSSERILDYPALSPDGKMLAFTLEAEGRVDLYARRVAGGARLRLTNDEHREEEPVFSPDGEQIAFTRLDRNTGESSIHVVPSLGGDAVPVIRGADAPAWSPDGSQLAFTHWQDEGDEQGYALSIANADGSARREILRGDAVYPFMSRVAWSPDGRSLCVERSTGGMSGELWIIDLDGGLPRRLDDDPDGVFSHSPSFTADGRFVLHSSNRAGAVNLWLLPTERGPARQLTTGSGPDLLPSISNDGSIAFLNSRERVILRIIELETGESRSLLSHGFALWGPVFSPDGSEIAFSRAEPSGDWNVWRVGADGTEPGPLTSGELPEIYPRYTPDGESIVYFTWVTDSSRNWLLPREGGAAVALSGQDGPAERYADVSPDGRSMAFTRVEDGRARIYVRPLEQGEERALTDGPSTLPRWSPDGTRIAFALDSSFSGGIWLVDADGGNKRRLTDTGGWPVWWPDGSRIGYQVVGPHGQTRLYTVVPDGGTPQILDTVTFRGINHPFDVSPDGGSLVTSDSRPVSSEIWLLRSEP